MTTEIKYDTIRLRTFMTRDEPVALRRFIEFWLGDIRVGTIETPTRQTAESLIKRSEPLDSRVSILLVQPQELVDNNTFVTLECLLSSTIACPRTAKTDG